MATKVKHFSFLVRKREFVACAYCGWVGEQEEREGDRQEGEEGGNEGGRERYLHIINNNNHGRGSRWAPIHTHTHVRSKQARSRRESFTSIYPLPIRKSNY
jgi:hypothetical protein